MPSQKAAIALIKAARALIAKEENWIQGAFCSERPERNRYCLVGALEKANDLIYNDTFYIARDLLNDARRNFPPRTNPSFMLGTPSLTAFNDAHTHAEVIALIDSAIGDAQ